MTDELTRERIEKVKKNVCISLDSLADENGEVAKSHKDDLSTMLALANAELERQSVVDEDVAEAIEWLDEDRRNLERKIAHTSSFNAGILRRELNRVRLAIQALAALDAVRWRNITDEQPTGDGEYPVLVKLKHTVMPEVMYYVPESGCAAFWRREYHYVTDELVSTDSIWWRYVDKWLPLPKWEEEAINRAFDDDHRGIGLTD